MTGTSQYLRTHHAALAAATAGDVAVNVLTALREQHVAEHGEDDGCFEDEIDEAQNAINVFLRIAGMAYRMAPEN